MKCLTRSHRLNLYGPTGENCCVVRASSVFAVVGEEKSNKNKSAHVHKFRFGSCHYFAFKALQNFLKRNPRLNQLPYLNDNKTRR